MVNVSLFSPKRVEIKTDEESIDTSKEDEIKNITDIASDKDMGSMQNKKITAISYMVMNLDKAKTILNKNESRSYPIASLTKLVTAVVSRRLNDKDKKIEINEKMLSAYGNDAHFRKGETYSASDLLYPLLLVSSNDASEALAQSYGRTKFIRAMNDFVQEIGAYNTYFVDPSGISPQNISNAHDLAIIVEWIYRHDPQILDITSNKSYSLRGHVWINPSHYLNNSKYIGGKNGYTPEAKLTTVAIMRLGKENQAYAIVLLGGKNRDGDIKELMQLVDTK
jgi:D-alanyl-D-alanine carboxypeptidase